MPIVRGSGVDVNAVAGRASDAARACSLFIQRVLRADQLSSLDNLVVLPLAAHSFGPFGRDDTQEPDACHFKTRFSRLLSEER